MVAKAIRLEAKTAERRPGFQEVEVSFVLPCLNERATLADCIEQARQVIYALGVPGEVIVADNGSTDGSQEIACRMGAHLVEVPVRGYGAALIYGCRAASGKTIVMADSDASYDLREAIPLLEKIQEGFDLVVGSRLRGKILPGAMPWKNRYLGNPALTGILNLFFHSGLSDAHSGLRAFTREAFERMDLRCTGMEFASEMIVKAVLTGLRRAEIPITYLPDGRNRPSHLRPWRDGWRHLRFLLLYSPSSMYMVPGMILFALGLALNTVLNLIPEDSYLTFGSIFFGTHWTVPATLAAVFGLQIVFLGLISLMYSVQTGLYPQPGWFARIADKISLELGLVMGLLCLLAGAGFESVILVGWIHSGFGALAEYRLALYGLMWILLGLESLFNSFILGLLAQGVTILPSAASAGHSVAEPFTSRDLG